MNNKVRQEKINFIIKFDSLSFHDCDTFKRNNELGINFDVTMLSIVNIGYRNAHLTDTLNVVFLKKHFITYTTFD